MNSRNELVIIVLMHLLLYVAIGFDIPVFRQVVAFVYLSVVPGFALLKVLKLRQISAFDTLLFSVGLSIASSMFVGLLVNTLFPLIGILQPLTLIPLATVLGFYTLLLYFIGSRHELLEPLTAKSWRAINLDTRTVVLTLPPILSIIGAVYGNVPILLIMLVITGTIMFLSISFERFVPAKLFPITIFAVSAALALHFSLISQHIIGYDAPLEYYVFKTTELSSHWSIIENVAYPIVTNFSSLLSVSILPTVYSSFMSIDGEILFKVFYPFVFSLVPVTLYRIFETQMSKRVALISVFLFVSGSLVFFGVEPLSLNRQIVA